MTCELAYLPTDAWAEIFRHTSMSTSGALALTCRRLAPLMPPITRYLTTRRIVRPPTTWDELPNGLRHGLATMRVGMILIKFTYAYGKLVSMSRGTIDSPDTTAWRGRRTARCYSPNRSRVVSDADEWLISSAHADYITVYDSCGRMRSTLVHPGIDMRNAAATLEWHAHVWPDRDPPELSERDALNGIVGERIATVLREFTDRVPLATCSRQRAI